MNSGEVDVFLREIRDALPMAPDFIVFDTLAQSMVGGDENTAVPVCVCGVRRNCSLRSRQDSSSMRS